jgi:GntR family transcriptional regulator/MocR family aminotransferase
MGKRAATLGLMLPERDPGIPAYQWLCAALRAEILEGRLRPGARLPATRDLAGQYALSRGTIVSAFAQLKAEGYVEGTVGSGTYVNRVLPDELLHVRRTSGTRSPPSRRQRRQISEFGERVRPFPRFALRRTRAFRANQSALDLFPTTLWAQVASRRLRRASSRLLQGCPPMGYRPLQEAVADYLRASRGVDCVPEQVVIVSGVQESLDLATRLCVNPGERVCLENPCYPGATLAMDALGAKVSAVPLDDEGMQLPGPQLQDVRLVYVTPAHQFPLGISMSLPRRLALLEWARSSGTLIFEDDYDSEYRYSGRPLPALQGLDHHGVVLFSGTFSKVLFPSIRMGYLVVPLDMVDAFAATKSVVSRHAPLLDQAVLCDFIVEGHFARHVRRMREIYADRHAALMEGVRRHLAGLLELTGVDAGLQTAGWLADGIDGEAITRLAAQRDVEVIPLSRFYRGGQVREGLHLGFAAVDSEEIRRGVRELADVLEGAVSSRKRRRKRNRAASLLTRGS